MNKSHNEKSTPVEYLESETQDQEMVSPHKFVHQQIEALLQELYNQGQRGLREVDIVNAYIEYLKKEEQIEYCYAEKQPNVHRALRKLIDTKKVHKADRRYHLLQPDNTKEVAEKMLIENVCLCKRNVFTISASTIVLYPTTATIAVAKDWLYRYLGSSCYGIACYDGYLIIMLVGKKDKLAMLRNDIKLLATKIYDKHNK